MEIRSFAYKVVSVPVRYTVISSVRRSEKIPFILLEIQTEEGLSGISYAQAFNEKAANSVLQLLDHFKRMLAGKNPLATEARWREMWDSTVLIGHAGLVSFAVSLVDIALWDLKGKYFEQPVYRLLGGEKETFDVYASDGLWLVDVEEAIRQSEQFVQEGFYAFKMRMGRTNWKEDIDVLHHLRKKWGDEIEIMADVNQGWSRHEAEEMIKRFEEYQLYWLEEPVSATDIEGYAHLQQISSTRICFGENIYGISAAEQCIAKKPHPFLHQICNELVG